MRRADRLNQIVHYLRRMRHAVTARRLGEEFGICSRTVYRDIQDLMNSGVPIHGEAGVGYIIDKKYHLPPVTFTPDELEALALGISVVRNSTDANFAAKAEAAFEKIQAIVPATSLHELQQISVHAMPNWGGNKWNENFSDVREAIRQRKKIEMHYRDANKAISKRVVQPLALYFFNPVWVLVSWCEKRNAFRNFRIDRIVDFEISDVYFPDDGDKNLAAYIRHENETCADTSQE